MISRVVEDFLVVFWRFLEFVMSFWVFFGDFQSF